VSSITLRSYLYAPGSRPDLLKKVFSAGADAVVLDLEDAVPEGGKEEARRAVVDAVTTHASGWSGETWVRINALDGDEAERDVASIVRPGLAGVRVPKVESVEALLELDRLLEETESACGLAQRSIAVTPVIESARGVLDARAIAETPRVHQLAFGGADFAADIDADPSDERTTLYARSHVVLASRAAGIAAPIAPVWTDLSDADGLFESSRAARRLGFGGRSTIHPRQLEAIHAAFSPSVEEIESARQVLAALREGGGASLTADRQFVDPAVARRARATLQLADRIASREGVAP